MKTRLLLDNEPLDNLVNGAEKLFKAVSTTMGPRGNNVIFRKDGMRTGVTHDGVTVAKAVKLDDPAEDVGADLLREAAMKLDATTGDGTTTVTVLSFAILKQAAAAIRNGSSPMVLRLGIEEEAKEAIKMVEDTVKKDPTKEDIINVATVASGDKAIGKEVGELVYDAGFNTPVILDFSENEETYSEVIDGFKINKGPASNYLIDGNGIRNEINEPMVIIVDSMLQTKDDVIPILKVMAQVPDDQRKFLLVAKDIRGDALSIVVLNALKGFAKTAVVTVPGYIRNPSLYLQDLAIATGAHVLSPNTGRPVSDISQDDIGSALKVIVELDATTVVKGGANKEELKAHIAKLGETTNSRVDKLNKDRLLTLEQKVISISVGGNNETEATEKHYRYEDAVGAARAALKNGVLPGGGTVLYQVGMVLGDTILGRALREPLRVVYSNAGIVVPQGITSGHGINVMKPEEGIIDLAADGILDPAQSETECIKTAVSIATLLMTSGAMIVDVAEEKKDETQQFPRIS